MNRLWAARSPRERVLLAALAVLALGWMGVGLIWQPLLTQRRMLAAGIPRLERALALVQAPNAADAATLATEAGQNSDPRPDAALITQSADRFGLRISRLEPQGPRVSLTLQDAPFETVLLWIEALQRDNALHLVDLTMTRRTAPGMVATVLMVER